MLGAFLLAALVFWPGNGSKKPFPMAAALEAAAPVPEVTFEGDIVPLLSTYCGDCHVDGTNKGDFALDRYHSADELKQDRAIWKKVFDRVKVGAMPPSDADQPTEAERARIVAWLDHQLYFVDCTGDFNPGRVTIRRLNKTEYNNTVRDLLGVDFQPAEDFPSDDVGYGFDNIGDVLSVPPLLVEKYLAAAEAIAKDAISTHDRNYKLTRWSGKDLQQDGAVRDGSSNSKVMISRGTAFPRIQVSPKWPVHHPFQSRAGQSGRRRREGHRPYRGKGDQNVQCPRTQETSGFHHHRGRGPGGAQGLRFVPQ